MIFYIAKQICKQVYLFTLKINKMSKGKIVQKSPYSLEMEPGTYYWCACGESSKQPFCDGSHKGTAFSPIKEVLEESKKVHWCGCKQSNRGGFCDGTHKSL